MIIIKSRSCYRLCLRWPCVKFLVVLRQQVILPPSWHFHETLTCVEPRVHTSRWTPATSAFISTALDRGGSGGQTLLQSCCFGCSDIYWTTNPKPSGLSAESGFSLRRQNKIDKKITKVVLYLVILVLNSTLSLRHWKCIKNVSYVLDTLKLNKAKLKRDYIEVDIFYTDK